MRGHGKGDHRAGSLDLMILGTHILDGMRYVADSEVAWAHGHVTQDGRPVTKDDIKEGDEGVGLLAGNRVAAYYVFENGLTAHYESFQGFPDEANDHNSHLGFEVYGTGASSRYATHRAANCTCTVTTCGSRTPTRGRGSASASRSGRRRTAAWPAT